MAVWRVWKPSVHLPACMRAGNSLSLARLLPDLLTLPQARLHRCAACTQRMRAHTHTYTRYNLHSHPGESSLQRTTLNKYLHVSELHSSLSRNCVFSSLSENTHRHSAITDTAYTSNHACMSVSARTRVWARARMPALASACARLLARALASSQVQGRPVMVRGWEGTVDWDAVASNCSTGKCLSNLYKRIRSKNSSRAIWARRGFPTVSSLFPRWAPPAPLTLGAAVGGPNLYHMIYYNIIWYDSIA